MSRMAVFKKFTSPRTACGLILCASPKTQKNMCMCVQAHRGGVKCFQTEYHDISCMHVTMDIETRGDKGGTYPSHFIDMAKVLLSM